MRTLVIRDLGRLSFQAAYAIQQQHVEERKQGRGSDTLLFVEHPHTITVGRNGKPEHLLASHQVLVRSGITFVDTNRGGDITYHGPGQLVGYPIFDLREWRRDVHAFFVAVEGVLIAALRSFQVAAVRDGRRGYEGVWVNGAKLAAIGIHLSRWISSHGFALNLSTNLDYFKYIVPCGLHEPVCSLQSLNIPHYREDVVSAIVREFAHSFEYQEVVSLEPGIGSAVNQNFQETR